MERALDRQRGPDSAILDGQALTMRPRPAVAITGTTGAQQRDRFALSKQRPYRWRGTPGWNPAAALGGWRSAGRKTRPCAYCGVKAGEQCRTVMGVPTRSYHSGR